tara:strand:- start:908 stop:3037 length:2130 start_codon:yes stop_codon:yes gene_type:complete
MFKRRQYNEGSGFQMTPMGGVYMPSVKNTVEGANYVGSLIGSAASAVAEQMANPAVLAASQGVASNMIPSTVDPATLPDYQVAAPRAVDMMSTGTTGAMAVQRMASGVGAHPGGAGRGKGAGGSLGQEARQAMKRKRLSKRIANRKAKGKDQIQLSKDAPKIRDDYDYAEGGRVGLYLGGLPKMFSKAILKKYSKDPKTKKLVEEIKEFETRIDEHKKIVAKQEQPEDVVKRLEKETGEPVYSSWQDLATEDMIELVYMENHLAKLYDDLLDIRDVNELQRIKNKSRSAYYDPDAMTDWEMEMGGSLGRKYTTPNFDEIDPADTVISEFYSKRKPKALGGILSNMSRKLLAKHKKDNVVKVLKKEVDKADKKLKDAKKEYEKDLEDFYTDPETGMETGMEGYDFDAGGGYADAIREIQDDRQKLAFQLERRLYDLEKKENPGVEYFVKERDFIEDIDPKERRPGYIDRLEREMDPYNPDNFSTYWTPVADYIDDEPFKSPFAEGGNVDAQMAAMMGGATHTMPDGTVHPGATHEEYEQMLAEGQAEDMAQEGMVPDEQMEEDFVDYVVESTLEPEDTMYLEEALAADPRLSEIFDQVIETASEFSGSGPVEGPGSEVSDSIPARLSDGEFVITSKATEEIGPENLQGMMEQAEMDADIRRAEAEGGYIDDDEDMAMIDPMQRTVNATEREMRKLQLAANPRTQYRTVYG